MEPGNDRGIAALFGFLGGVFLALDGLLDLVSGAVYVAIRRNFAALGAFDEGIVLVVLGLVVAFLALLGRHRAHDRSLAAGIALVLLAFLGWLALGLGTGVLAVLGLIFVLISGILFLVFAR